MKGLLFVILLLALLGSCRNISTNQKAEIEVLNRELEGKFNSGDMLGVAHIYDKEAHLLSRYIQLHGREQIEAYWQEIEEPISWKLELIELSPSYKDIERDSVFLLLDKPPAHWNTYGVSLEENKSYLFEFGKSELTRIWKGEEKMSVVYFILVWGRNDQGQWRILIDTY